MKGEINMFRKFKNLISEATIAGSQYSNNRDQGLEQYLRIEYGRR